MIIVYHGRAHLHATALLLLGQQHLYRAAHVVSRCKDGINDRFSGITHFTKAREICQEIQQLWPRQLTKAKAEDNATTLYPCKAAILLKIFGLKLCKVETVHTYQRKKSS